MVIGLSMFMGAEPSGATVYRCTGPSDSLIFTDSPTQQEQCTPLPNLSPPPTTSGSGSSGRGPGDSMPFSGTGVTEVPVPESERPPDAGKIETQAIPPPQNTAAPEPAGQESGSMFGAKGDGDSQKRLLYINPLNPLLPVPVDPAAQGQQGQ